MNCHYVYNTIFKLQTVPDETILSQLSSAVKGLMCWTNPVGQHAIETFKAITLEQKAPGTLCNNANTNIIQNIATSDH